MKHGWLWQISVRTSPGAEDAVADLLGAAFGQPASSYTDADSQQVTVSVYSPDGSAWSVRRRELVLGLEQLACEGWELGAGRLTRHRIARQDWAESWKRHFQPLAIGSALLLKPSWSRRRPARGQAVIVLDLGLSFGTGHHPTTAFCLRQLAGLRREGQAQSCLDVGTGSGILAIAAAKLGYRRVDALDCDPDTIPVARRNARRNGVGGRIHFLRQDLAELPGRSARRYSVVCANLVASLLVAEQQRLLARLQPEGTLLAAGILKTEFARVREAFERAGLRLTASEVRGEWRSGAFRWR